MRWLGAERFAVGDTVFQIPPAGQLLTADSLEGADFFVMKDRAAVERYAALATELRPQRIVELGVFQGGSTALLCELFEPRRLVAIDNQPVGDALRAYPAIELHDDVDQADRSRLAAIVGEEPLDLVVDDCSHLYEPTRASFNELFPRLRPGGRYVIEDWRWAHPAVGSADDDIFPGEVPLTRLVFEIVLALPSVPGLVTDVRIGEDSVWVERGQAAADPSRFDISECCRPRGRALLA